MPVSVKRIAVLASALSLVTACGSDTGATVNRKAPEIIQFFASPTIAEPGQTILVGWDTSNANRVALFERTISEVLLPLYQTEQVMTGNMEYRAHASLDLVLIAYNTNSDHEPVESAVSIDVDIPEGRHIESLYPDPAYVQPGDPATIKFSVKDVGAGWSLTLADLSGTGTALTQTFAAASVLTSGSFTAASCTAASILCIDGHTGYSAELKDETGAVLEYRETSVGVTSIDLPHVIQFEFDDEEIMVGSTTTLRWEVSNADQVEIQPTVGPQYCVDMVCVGAEVLSPTFTQSFVLTAWGPGGAIVSTRSISVVSVPTPPTVDSFTAAPTGIRPGTLTTLSWTTTLATTVEITAVPADASLPGSFTADGSATVTPTATTTYTITATNIHGNDTDTETVTVTPLAAGDLVITEIMVQPTTDPGGEWFEIHNPGTMQANLNGLVIDSGSGETDTIDSVLLVDAGGYVLLAASSDDATNDHLPTPDFVYSGISFEQTGTDSLSVSRGATVIDDVSWNAASWPIYAGYSMSVSVAPDATTNDVVGSWCAAGNMWTGATSSYGSPLASHDACD